MTLQAITSECERLLNLKHDTATVQLEGHGGPEVHAIHQATQQPGPINSGPTKSASHYSGPKQNKGPMMLALWSLALRQVLSLQASSVPLI
ncbi:hypothetical protein CSKR_202115 [Clonorchis sinensis]|uniref:Uncharacterized protein n=1 Tax=Clonorchis sinensis TaxID=79923 RepID=A0A8T1LUM7_CLOSI|nr:hypothetical protein CSKR_202115 [Clonorchis sinensis]